MYYSGFGPYHSTGTVIIRVINHLLKASVQGCVSLLGLLNLSEAFNATNQTILLDILELLLELRKVAQVLLVDHY